MRHWLKEIRKKTGMSQYKAAEVCGISQSYYGAVEVGTRNVPVPTAKKIANGLGFDWQRFYEDEKTPITKIGVRGGKMKKQFNLGMTKIDMIEKIMLWFAGLLGLLGTGLLVYVIATIA